MAKTDDRKVRSASPKTAKTAGALTAEKAAKTKRLTAVAILRNARALIRNPRHWLQGSYSRDINGNAASLADPSAVCFCAQGAIWRAGHSLGNGDPMRLTIEDRASALLGTAMRQPIENYNDKPGRKHAQVVAAFDRAIKRAALSPSSR